MHRSLASRPLVSRQERPSLPYKLCHGGICLSDLILLQEYDQTVLLSLLFLTVLPPLQQWKPIRQIVFIIK